MNLEIWQHGRPAFGNIGKLSDSNIITVEQIRDADDLVVKVIVGDIAYTTSGLSIEDIIIDITVNAIAIEEGILSSFFMQEEPLFHIEFREGYALFCTGTGKGSRELEREKKDMVAKYLHSYCQNVCEAMGVDIKPYKALAKADLRSAGRSAFLVAVPI